MRRLVSRISPSVAVVLTGLWLLLNQSLSVGHVALGAVLGVALAGFASTLRPLHSRVQRFDVASMLLLVVMRDIVHSNLSVARVVLSSKIPRSVFVRIPIDLRDPHGLAALAVIVTANPGTVWAGLSDSGDSLALHVLDLTSETELIDLVKQRYERRLMRIFE